VLLIYEERGLIGAEMFAVDGCRLPRTPRKELSGTGTDLQEELREEKAIDQERAF
jgi:hypothetical protein